MLDSNKLLLMSLCRFRNKLVLGVVSAFAMNGVIITYLSILTTTGAEVFIPKKRKSQRSEL